MVVRYPLLVDALRLLPGVRPVCERYRLGEAKLRASRSPKLVAYFNGVALTLSQLEELFVYGEHGGPRVSQEGAKLLLKLFDDAAFDRSDPRSVAGGLELLTQYSQGHASVLDYRVPKARHPRQYRNVETSAKKVEQPSTALLVRSPPITVHRIA